MYLNFVFLAPSRVQGTPNCLGSAISLTYKSTTSVYPGWISRSTKPTVGVLGVEVGPLGELDSIQLWCLLLSASEAAEPGYCRPLHHLR
jgi:hypothetical protein